VTYNSYEFQINHVASKRWVYIECFKKIRSFELATRQNIKCYKINLSTMMNSMASFPRLPRPHLRNLTQFWSFFSFERDADNKLYKINSSLAYILNNILAHSTSNIPVHLPTLLTLLMCGLVQLLCLSFVFIITTSKIYKV
jgi:hypothetical protein